MSAQVTCSIAGPIATITLRNADRRNALSTRLLGELEDTLHRIEESPDLRVVVLTGSGSAFCVGADLAAAPGTRTLRRDSVAADSARLRRAARVAQQLHELPQLTLAAINGACAGAGLSLALAMDLRIASESAVFNTAFLSAGLSGDLGGIWFLTQAFGAARARELFLMPGRLSARRAVELGLVTEIGADAEFAELTESYAVRLASTAPVAARAMKQNLLDAATTTLDEYLGHETERMVRSFHTADAREAAAAFLERREPAFSGR